jgi:nucleotide-binding universal stress UspA family protein
MKILIPVDGSDCALNAVRHFLETQKLFRDTKAAEVHLLTVQPALSRGVTMFVDADAVKKYHQEEAHKELASARALLDQAGVPYAVHIIVGEPAQVIAQYAKDNGIEQIIMGAHGRGAIASFVVGSVTQKVLNLAEVPVLVVK